MGLFWGLTGVAAFILVLFKLKKETDKKKAESEAQKAEAERAKKDYEDFRKSIE